MDEATAAAILAEYERCRDALAKAQLSVIEAGRRFLSDLEALPADPGIRSGHCKSHPNGKKLYLLYITWDDCGYSE